MRILPPLPLNESREHFLLKQVGLVYLKWARRCQYVGLEIALPRSRLLEDSSPRLVADVVGVHRDSRTPTRQNDSRYRWTLYTVEVKVSRSDFKAGYCRDGHYVFLLTPPGLLSTEELPPEDGLLEVDPHWVSSCGRPEQLVQAVTVRRPARRRKLSVDSSGLHPGVEVVTRIAASWTNRMVFWNPYLFSWAGD